VQAEQFHEPDCDCGVLKDFGGTAPGIVPISGIEEVEEEGCE